jgi:hypothetical protein
LRLDLPRGEHDENDPDLVAIDPARLEMTVCHCLRCDLPLEPGNRGLDPGPFCGACLVDILASARSFAGSPGEVADRYNSKLLQFVQQSHQRRAS